MSQYAKNTTVNSAKSRAEIERTLTKYGAEGFMYGWRDNKAIIAFEMLGKRIQFRLPLPDKNSKEFQYTPSRRRKRTGSQIEEEYEKAIRQKWRALALIIKAKLEAIESGIAIFEDEFLANIMLPNGQSMGDWIRPQIEIAYTQGSMPRLLA